jgi:hypothetical protein
LTQNLKITQLFWRRIKIILPHFILFYFVKDLKDKRVLHMIIHFWSIRWMRQTKHTQWDGFRWKGDTSSSWKGTSVPA